MEAEALWGSDDNVANDVRRMTPVELQQRIRLIDTEIRAMHQQCNRLQHEITNVNERVKENQEKIKLNKQLPYLIANVVEVSLIFKLLSAKKKFI